MKIRSTIFLIAILFVLSGQNASAQRWLDKLSKAIDKVEKKIQVVEETLVGPTEESESQTTGTGTNDNSQSGLAQAYRNVETFSNDLKVPVKFVSCIRNGEDVTVEFEIGNYTETDMEMIRFGAPKQLANQVDVTSITDNTGRNHNIHSATIGGKTNVLYSMIGSFYINKGTNVKGSIIVKGVPKPATAFQIFKIAFDNGMSGGYVIRYFSFKNLPILSMADIARFEQEAKQKEFERLVAKANAGDANAQYLVGTAYYNNGDHAKAIDYYTKSADAGNANAQGQMAYGYLYGLAGLTADLNKALLYAQKAKDQGDMIGYYVLGVMYAQGNGVEKDENKAIECLTYAANRGDNVDAQEWLGILYTNKDKTLSAQWSKKAADKGGIYGIRSTANNYLNGRGLPEDKEKALEYYLKGVDKNDAECLYYAGLMYRRGWGCYEDLTKAKGLLLKSAAKDNADGFRELAYYYLFNEEDYIKAIDYFERAIAKGDLHSLPYLADMYENGKGTLKNPTKAKALYTQSAEKGNSTSQYKLGMMAKESNDLKGAFNWFSKSADAGASDAQYELGLMYYYAKGTVKNTKKAAEYIEKSHKQGNKDAEQIWNNLQLWKYM